MKYFLDKLLTYVKNITNKSQIKRGLKFKENMQIE